MKHSTTDTAPLFAGAVTKPKGFNYTEMKRDLERHGQGSHPNSRAAWRSLDLTSRQRAVLAALDAIGRPATDKDVMRQMGSADPNCARPRITELVRDGVLAEVGSVKDEQSGCNVRQVWFTETSTGAEQ